MNFDKNTKNFTSQIAGAVTGVTKQVSGLNDILQNFQDNDNNLMEVKLGGINDPVTSSNLDKNKTTLAQFSSGNANVAPIIEGNQHFVLQQSTGASYGSQIATNYGTHPRMAIRSYTSASYSSWAEVYTTLHKPTKADIGLGNVPNYSASDSVSSTSNVTLATSGAVKHAYDRADSAYAHATDGINRANTAQAKANLAETHAQTGITNAHNAQTTATAGYGTATSALQVANANTAKVNTAQSRADSAYSLAGTKMTTATGDGRYIKLSGTSTLSNGAHIKGSVFILEATEDLSLEGHIVRYDAPSGHAFTGNVMFNYPYEVTVGGKFTNSSDINLKKNIIKEEDSLSKIYNLSGYNYNRIDGVKDDETLFSGVIAQEVEKEYPHMVSTNEETGMKSVAYTELIAPMIEAIKELKDMNEKLANRVLELENK